MLSASGLLRYLEQAAIGAAGERGFGRDFSAERGSTWVIRRMFLQLDAQARAGDTLTITTWLSHLERVRGGREYRISDADNTPLAQALGEWVYLDRNTLRPIALPPDLLKSAIVPGAPLGSYDAETLPALTTSHVTEETRTAQWYECDSHGHVNNSVYVDWLDEGVRSNLASLGFAAAPLRDLGIHLRGTHYRLEYKRAALPEDQLTIETRLIGVDDRRCEFTQNIKHASGADVLTAHSLYSWLDLKGAHTTPPDAFLAKLLGSD